MRKYCFAKLIKNEEAYELLAQYLESNFCLELLNFVEHVNDFNLVVSSGAKKTRAIAIYETFIKSNSDQEVNIDHKVRKITEDLYKDAMNEKIAFDKVYRVAYKSICLDLLQTFTAFVLSPAAVEFFNKKEKELSPTKFAFEFCNTEEEEIEFIKTMDTYKETKDDFVIDVDYVFQQHKSDDLLTVNVDITKEELEDVFSTHPGSLSQKPFSTKLLFNKMIVDLMKTFSGVQLSEKPKMKIEKKKTGLFSKKPKEEEKKEEKRQKVFEKTNFNKWIANYYNIEITHKAIPKIMNLLIKYKIIEEYKDEKSNKYPDYYTFIHKKKLVIVGNGFAGNNLGKELRDDFDIIIIDKKNKFKFNIGFYKLFSDPTYIDKIELENETVTKGCTLIKATVKAISPSCVYLCDKVVPFDYLFVCTGSSYSIPFKINLEPFAPRFNTSLFDFNEEVQQKQIKVITPYDPSLAISHFADIRDAEHVIIAGTGPVGIEIIGELAYKYPNKRITAITQSGTIMDRQSSKCHQAAMKIIKKFKNLEVIFNASITRIEKTSVFYRKVTIEEKVKGVEIELKADVAILCLGLRPNTRVFRTFMSDSLGPTGFVKVNDFFEVQYGSQYLGDKKLMEMLTKETKKQQEEYLKQCEKTSDSMEKEELPEEEPENTNMEETIGNIFYKLLAPDPENIYGKEEMENVYSNIFALGDIIDSPDEKLGYFARTHSTAVKETILLKEFSLTKEDYLKNRQRYPKGKLVVQIINIGNEGLVMKGKNLYSHGGFAKSLKNAFEYVFVGMMLPS
eukprot:gene1526-12652_t